MAHHCIQCGIILINLLSFIIQIKFQNIFKDTVDETINTLKNKWNDHINNDVIEAVRLFNLEEFKFKKETITFITDWGSEYLTKYKIIQNVKKEEVKNMLLLQLNEFISRQNEFVFINSKNNEFKKIYVLQNKQYNIKCIWANFLPTYHELSKVAIALLSICPSEASVERSFSAQSDVHSLDRNRLSDEIIEAEMNIKINKKYY